MSTLLQIDPAPPLSTCPGFEPYVKSYDEDMMNDNVDIFCETKIHTWNWITVSLYLHSTKNKSPWGSVSRYRLRLR
jgi:hypothetical protein